MKENRIGIIMNGVTGRMGTNQHLMRSIVEIIKQGGVKLSEEETIIPDPVLVGRNEAKLKKLAKKETKALAEKELLIKQWDLDHLEADLSFCGRDGSPTKVHRIQNVVLTAQESMQVEPTESGIAEMVHGLIEEHTIG